jgi:hypothetical protein
LPVRASQASLFILYCVSALLTAESYASLEIGVAGGVVAPVVDVFLWVAQPAAASAEVINSANMSLPICRTPYE